MKHYRIFAMLLAIAMLLTMAVGCGQSAEQNGTSTKETANEAPSAEAENKAPSAETENEAPSAETENEAPVQENADATGDAPVQSETDASAPVENTADENNSAGSIFDDAYYNAYFGFHFAPSDWTYYEDEVLQSMTDATYVMAAVNSAGETVSVSVDPTLPEHKQLSEDELYAKLLLTAQAQLQQLGMPDASVEISTANFLGEEHPALHSKIGAAGVEQKQIYLVEDEQTCIITVTSLNEETVDAVIGLFSR